jgi:hypothetical protein
MVEAKMIEYLDFEHKTALVDLRRKWKFNVGLSVHRIHPILFALAKVSGQLFDLHNNMLFTFNVHGRA